jgi:hypothetical protein
MTYDLSAGKGRHSNPMGRRRASTHKLGSNKFITTGPDTAIHVLSRLDAGTAFFPSGQNQTADLSARRSVSMDCRVVMGKTRFALLPGDDQEWIASALRASQ